jgi:hypothetical protein
MSFNYHHPGKLTYSTQPREYLIGDVEGSGSGLCLGTIPGILEDNNEI